MSLATYWNGLYCILGSRPHKWTHVPLRQPWLRQRRRSSLLQVRHRGMRLPAVARCLGVSFDVAASSFRLCSLAIFKFLACDIVGYWSTYLAWEHGTFQYFTCTFRMEYLKLYTFMDSVFTNFAHKQSRDVSNEFKKLS